MNVRQYNGGKQRCKMIVRHYNLVNSSKMNVREYNEVNRGVEWMSENTMR